MLALSQLGGMRISACPLPALADDQPEAIPKHQQYEERDRQTDAQGQRFHCTVTSTLIPVEKEKTGKQAAYHANQHEQYDELEHGRLQ
jgi:hypothetical protein